MDSSKAKGTWVGLQDLWLTNYMTISIIYCSITNYPNSQWLKTPRFYCIQFFVLEMQADSASKSLLHVALARPLHVAAFS